MKKNKWYPTTTVPPNSVKNNLIVRTDMGYLYNAVYDNGVFKVPAFNDHVYKYYTPYYPQESLSDWMAIDKLSGHALHCINVRKIRSHKWYPRVVKPKYRYNLLVLLGSLEIKEAFYENGEFKISEEINGKVYFNTYPQVRILAWMNIGKI